MARLEAVGRHGWRSFIGGPLAEWPEEALLGFLGESHGWAVDYAPADAELKALAAGRGDHG